MKTLLMIPLVDILAYASGLVLEVIVEGSDSKLQTQHLSQEIMEAHKRKSDKNE